MILCMYNENRKDMKVRNKTIYDVQKNDKRFIKINTDKKVDTCTQGGCPVDSFSFLFLLRNNPPPSKKEKKTNRQTKPQTPNPTQKRKKERNPCASLLSFPSTLWVWVFLRENLVPDGGVLSSSFNSFFFGGSGGVELWGALLRMGGIGEYNQHKVVDSSKNDWYTHMHNIPPWRELPKASLVHGRRRHWDTKSHKGVLLCVILCHIN